MRECHHLQTVGGRWFRCALSSEPVSDYHPRSIIPCDRCIEMNCGQFPNEPIVGIHDKPFIEIIPFDQAKYDEQIAEQERRFIDPCIHRSDDPVEESECGCVHKSKWSCDHPDVNRLIVVRECGSCQHYE